MSKYTTGEIAKLCGVTVRTVQYYDTRGILIPSLFAMLLHIGLTVVVYYGVVNENKICLPSAIILHMLMDLFPALYQRNVVVLCNVELWAATWVGVTVFIAVKLYRKRK